MTVAATPLRTGLLLENRDRRSRESPPSRRREVPLGTRKLGFSPQSPLAATRMVRMAGVGAFGESLFLGRR